jgi:hypothetical protein
MATCQHIVRSNGVLNEYNSLAPSHEFSTLRIKSNNYEYTTLVNTRLVPELVKFVWFRHSSEAYTGASINDETRNLVDRFHIFDGVDKTLLLHRYIAALAQIPNTNGGTYIDHIDRLTLDNRIENLRWATQSEQNRNQGKKKRQCTAKDLPTDIVQKELPKYVTWNPEEKRTFFRIEGHPALKVRQWSSSKSKKFTNQEKYDMTIQHLHELDAMVDPDPEAPFRKKLVEEFQNILKSQIQ